MILPHHSERIASVDGSDSTRYIDNDAEPGTTYRYWITSHNNWKESNFSKFVDRPGGENDGVPEPTDPDENEKPNNRPFNGNSDGRPKPSTNRPPIGSSSGRPTTNRPFNASTSGRENTAAMMFAAVPSEPEALVLADYDGGGLAGVATSYLAQDEVGDTMRKFVVNATRPDLHYIKQFDVAEDVSNYDQLAFDYRSQFYDAEGTLQIQLRFANKERPGVRNFWNCKSSVPLSAGYGDWTRVFVDLSETNFQLGIDWHPGCDFNLDMLEGVAVMIRTNGSDTSANIIDLDNIQLLVNENK